MYSEGLALVVVVPVLKLGVSTIYAHLRARHTGDEAISLVQAKACSSARTKAPSLAATAGTPMMLAPTSSSL